MQIRTDQTQLETNRHMCVALALFQISFFESGKQWQDEKVLYKKFIEI